MYNHVVRYFVAEECIRHVKDGIIPRPDELVSFDSNLFPLIYMVHNVEYMIDTDVVCVYLIPSGMKRRPNAPRNGNKPL